MSSKNKEGVSKGRRWRFSRKKMKNNSTSSSGICFCFVVVFLILIRLRLVFFKCFKLLFECLLLSFNRRKVFKIVKFFNSNIFKTKYIT